jgi:hypothetical protein
LTTPVLFLLSAFRCGSTWLWSRFRQAAGTCAFYEPYNEVLADLSETTLGHAGGTDPRLGHPPLDRPVFDQYRPLLGPEGGVMGYRRRFAIDAHFTADSADDPEQRAFLDGLIGHARRHDRVPVLGFCRSRGRVAWLRRVAPGLHIAGWRDPWDQWASFAEQTTERRNAYFEVRAFLVACVGRARPKTAGFFRGLALPDAGGPILGREQFLEDFFFDCHAERRFRIFLRVVMLDMLRAFRHLDHLIDMDALSTDPRYRNAMVVRLRADCALPDLDFSGCALPRHALAPDAACLRAVGEALGILDEHVATHLEDAPGAAFLAARIGAIRQRPAPAAESVDGTAEAFGIDRIDLCHVLQAIETVMNAGNDTARGVAYLRSIYDDGFDSHRETLAAIAAMVGAAERRTSAAKTMVAEGLRLVLER